MQAKKHGLFVGLLTLDLAYLTNDLPSNNQKIVATDYTLAAGGPATNAAVTFSHLRDRSTLVSVMGAHPITNLIKGDLETNNITLRDLDPGRLEPPSVSSIMITQQTGERAVISIDAKKTQAHIKKVPADILNNVHIVLIDGHQMQVGQTIAELAKQENIPIVIDGGRWKPGFDRLLPLADYAICSADFHPPNCQNSEDAIAYLSSVGIEHIAITDGEKPIRYISQGKAGSVEIPPVNTVDTLGAGDIFHGAFCHYILRQKFTEALVASARIASFSCQFFGTRRWMDVKEQKESGTL